MPESNEVFHVESWSTVPGKDPNATHVAGFYADRSDGLRAGKFLFAILSRGEDGKLVKDADPEPLLQQVHWAYQQFVQAYQAEGLTLINPKIFLHDLATGEDVISRSL